MTTACGCATAKPDKDIYEPGESGSVNATFEFGDRTGNQHKTGKKRGRH